MREIKDSGVPWIGEIPVLWQVSKIGNFFCFHSGDTLTSERIKDSEENDYRYVVYGANGIRGYYTSSNTHGRRILIGRVGALCGNVHIADGDYWVTEHALIAREKLCLCKEYYSFVFEAMNLGQYSKATAQPVISSETISLKRFPVPSLSEQQRIAKILSEKCAGIDSILEKTRTSIEEYKALKQSVITEAVTKGIHTDRPMKKTESVWFAEIPSTWGFKRLKYLFRIEKRIAGETGHTVLAITQKGVVPKNMDYGNGGQFAEDYSNYQLVYPGDFAMNHMDLLTGWVDISRFAGVTSPDYRVFTLIDQAAYSAYYLYFMQMCYMDKIFYGMGAGVSGMGRWRLQADKFLNFFIPIPPYAEQQEIAVYLDEKCTAIDSLIASKEALIAELEAYKKSIIYEYVTGKKEVPAV